MLRQRSSQKTQELNKYSHARYSLSPYTLLAIEFERSPRQYRLLFLVPHHKFIVSSIPMLTTPQMLATGHGGELNLEWK